MSLFSAHSDAHLPIVSPSSPFQPKAQQACVSCRKQKRKCDKTLPTCGLCARMARPCDYTADTAQPPPGSTATASELATLQARLNELESRLNISSTQAAHEQQQQYQPPIQQQQSSASAFDHNSNSNHTSSAALPPIPPKPQIQSPLWLPSLSRFPSAIFLDIDCFNWASMPIPKPAVDVPAEVFEILNARGPNTVQEVAHEYFNGTHAWFPIVSRKRMSLGLSLWDGGPELAFLFLAMKLVTALPSPQVGVHHCSPAAFGNITSVCSGSGVLGSEEVNGSASRNGGGGGCGQDTLGMGPGPNFPLYAAAKRFMSLLENGGSVSLQLLQGMVLVALYEIGHGVYPAAWMTVAACARYAEVLGLPSFRGSSRMLGTCATWTEKEERTRVWWAIYVLDRAICLGNKKRFCMPEPDEDVIKLPADDRAWDEGDPSRGPAHPITLPPTSPTHSLGPFARLCQSAMQVSKALTTVRAVIHGNVYGKPVPFSLPTLTELSESLASFANHVQNEISPHQASPFNNSMSGTTATPSSSSASTVVQQQGYSFLSLLPALSLSLSGLILIFDVYCSAENQHLGPGSEGPEAPPLQGPEHEAFRIQSVQGLREVSFKVRDVSIEVLDAVILPTEQRKLSPLSLDALYGAMATLHWLWKEGGDSDVREALEDVRRCLGRVSMRWRLATEYLDLIRHHDVNFAMTWRAST
ncbi:hypothetical protein QBC35DRAFT_489655 [Podospora australis]|uniref:Zn(2)-C6 fungal-type domain-containing protein n=1 Tax=Podospora australis TaxID=1536484 RepID=A0AAN7ALH7_9PEZI|nr:hypothetical protein QBC35DRAFT_489655 [Podospora australis]